MAANPHIRALTDLLIGVVLREWETADEELRKEILSDASEKENAPEGARQYENLTT